MAPPPGYVPYGGQNVGAYSAYQPINGVSKWLGMLMMAYIPLQLISILVLLRIRSKARDLINDRITADEYTSSTRSLNLVSILVFIVVIAALVLTMIWMSRMAKNQQLMQRGGTWTPGWAIAGWFCPPCVLYVIPYLMFKDLWKSSDPDSGADWRRNPVSSIVHIWWVLYGLLPIAFIAVTVNNFRIGGSVQDAASRINKQFAYTALSNLTQVLAAVAFLMLVRQLSARHKLVTHES